MRENFSGDLEHLKKMFKNQGKKQTYQITRVPVISRGKGAIFYVIAISLQALNWKLIHLKDILIKICKQKFPFGYSTLTSAWETSRMLWQSDVGSQIEISVCCRKAPDFAV